MKIINLFQREFERKQCEIDGCIDWKPKEINSTTEKVLSETDRGISLNDAKTVNDLFEKICKEEDTK